MNECAEQRHVPKGDFCRRNQNILRVNFGNERLGDVHCTHPQSHHQIFILKNNPIPRTNIAVHPI
jgi:hypothetical protein